MSGYAYITPTDGKPKQWMCDSVWHELGPTERRLVTQEIADAARTHFSNTGTSGVREAPTVKIEPYAGDVDFGPVAVATKITDPETGEEYENTADLIAAVKARAAAAAMLDKSPPEKAPEVAPQQQPKQGSGFFKR